MITPPAHHGKDCALRPGPGFWHRCNDLFRRRAASLEEELSVSVTRRKQVVNVMQTLSGQTLQRQFHYKTRVQREQRTRELFSESRTRVWPKRYSTARAGSLHILSCRNWSTLWTTGCRVSNFFSFPNKDFYSSCPCPSLPFRTASLGGNTDNVGFVLYVLGKAVSCTQSLGPNSAASEWALGLKHFLPRDKGPTQPVPGLSPCVGISFLVLYSMSTLLSLLKASVSNGSWPTPQLCLSSAGKGQIPSTAAPNECI